MKVKKIEDILLYVGAGAVALAFVLLAFAPVFGNDLLSFNGFEIFGMGFVTLFSFRFSEAPVMLFFFLFLFSLICLALWAIQIARKDSTKESWIKFAISAVSMILIFSIMSGVFAASVDVNGTSQNIYAAMNKIPENGFAKFLVIFSVALSYLSLMANTLYAFVNFGMLNLVGPEYREKELPFGDKK